MKNPEVNKTYYGKQSFASVVVKEVSGQYVKVLYEGAKDTVPVPLAYFFKKFSETNPKDK